LYFVGGLEKLKRLMMYAFVYFDVLKPNN